ncbi:MAG: helix-turn-helix transcriptional regulator [Herbiconiux sp.]|nr:helix-turn-helix transcriptional regulator [Herbiconiux sp.]
MTEHDGVARAVTEGHDLDEARAMYQADYRGDDFSVELGEREFAYRYTVGGDADMTLRSSMFLGSVTGSIQPENEYIVSWLHEGRSVMDLGGDETPLADGRPAMFPTGKRFTFDAADYRQSLIHFRAGYLEQVAAEHEGSLNAAIAFNHAALPDPDALTRWNTVVAEAARVVLQGEPTPLELAEVKRQTAVALLDTFDHEVAALPEALVRPRNARLRLAVDYLHGHAHLPVTPGMVAAEAGLSARGLQQAFQRQLGVTPSQYLRGIRLDRVRAELTHLAPGETTVGEVAARWGFTHLGRFAQAYTARFGEYPRATLQR